ncbi:MAG: short chain dehydrogenase [Methanoregulaceae archaeon PtaB.Bin108]|nr:MAG: short chain dehydrogenase [Methanoregulaceae archaeon PtaB.Bin108]OPY44826.1 MAG: short chain dehydrogenase [Methanoregulaceae archaeon PtaU1.Bin222]
MPNPVILVTGSTDGIGKAMVRELAGSGADVILHGRDPEKGREVLKDLKRHGWNRNLDLVIADYRIQDQVRHMAEEISSRYPRLDVLINNAGTFEKLRSTTPDGIETTFAVNYLGPFLLTSRLLPLLEKGGHGRIVNMSSDSHRDIRQVDWENLQGEKRYDPYEAYARSALAGVAFTFSLARKTGGTGITAHCVHPGIVASRMLRSGYPGIRGKAPSEGAKIPVYLALSPEAATCTGEYFNESIHPEPASDLSRDLYIQEKFWRIASDLTKTGAGY